MRVSGYWLSARHVPEKSGNLHAIACSGFVSLNNGTPPVLRQQPISVFGPIACLPQCEARGYQCRRKAFWNHLNMLAENGRPNREIAENGQDQTDQTDRTRRK